MASKTRVRPQSVSIGFEEEGYVVRNQRAALRSQERAKGIRVDYLRDCRQILLSEVFWRIRYVVESPADGRPGVIRGLSGPTRLINQRETGAFFRRSCQPLIDASRKPATVVCADSRGDFWA